MKFLSKNIKINIVLIIGLFLIFAGILLLTSIFAKNPQSVLLFRGVILFLVGAVVLFLGSLIMMFVTNWLMAIAAVVSTMLGFSVMTIIMKKSQKYFLEQQNRLGELNGVIEETYSGQTVIKTYNAKQEFKDKFEKVNKKLYQSGWKAQFASGTMHPIMGFVGNLGYVIVCVIGAVLFIEGKISFGVITAFMIYIRLFTNLKFGI